MIETAYALKKFLSCANLAFPEDERKDIDFLINVETITAVENFDSMLALQNIDELKGIVVGRVDMTGSMGLTREDINTDKIRTICDNVLSKVKTHRKLMECVIGGGVSKETLPFFSALKPGLLDKYETRKVLFKYPDAAGPIGEKGILKAVGFELLWLKNKRNFYGMIYKEDENRIMMLEQRYDKLITQAGGKH